MKIELDLELEQVKEIEKALDTLRWEYHINSLKAKREGNCDSAAFWDKLGGEASVLCGIFGNIRFEEQRKRTAEYFGKMKKGAK